MRHQRDAVAAQKQPRCLALPPTSASARAHTLLSALLTTLRRMRELAHGVLWSALQVYAIRVIGAGLTYAATILLARWLGAREFGIYAYVLVIASLLGIAFCFGFNSSALRFIASYRAAGKRRRLAGFLRQSFGLVAVLGIVGAALGAGILYAVRPAFAPYYVVPLLIGMASVPIWALLNQLEATARAFGWMQVAYAPGYVLRPLLLIGVFGALLFAGAAADAVTALWAVTAACALSALAQGLVVGVRMRRILAGVRPICHPRPWIAVSFGFLAIDGLRMLLDNTDVLLLGKLMDPHSVAVYFAVIRTGGLVAFVSFSVISLTVPKFAEIHRTGSREALQRLVSHSIQLMFWPSLATAAALALAGPFVLSLFGADFRAGYPALLVVLAGLVVRAATGPVEYLLNMTGHHRDTLGVYAVAAAANIGLNLLLIPTLGIVGAALATYAAMLTGNAWLYLLVRKRLGVHAFVFPLRVRARSPAEG
jgi:O-antigen/teichoic acid export membrane protein